MNSKIFIGSSKKRVIVFAVAVAVLVVGLASWAVYALWYQNPSKVVADALMNAMSAKSATFSGSGSVTNYGESYSYTLAGQAGREEGTSATLELKSQEEMKIGINIVRDQKGTDYAKLENAKNLAPHITSILEKGMSDNATGKKVIKNMLDFFLVPILNSIDNEWIRLNRTDVKRLDARIGEAYECLDNSYKRLGDDTDMQRELGDRYRNNTFLVIQKSSSQAGKMSVSLKVDKPAAQKFLNSLRTSKFYNELTNCYQNAKQLLDDITKQVNAVPNDHLLQLEIDQWTRQITKMNLETKDKNNSLSFDMSFKFNVPVNITIPKDSMSFDEAIRDLGQVFGNDPNSPQALLSRGII